MGASVRLRVASSWVNERWARTSTKRSNSAEAFWRMY